MKIDRCINGISIEYSELNKAAVQVAITILLVILCACSTDAAITPTALVGTWRADYHGQEISEYTVNTAGQVSLVKRPLTGVETITIKADGTYQQTYDVVDSEYHYTSPWNAWSLDLTSPSQGLLLLKEGRRYPLGIDLAEARSQQKGICEDFWFDEPYSALKTACRNTVLEVNSSPSGLILRFAIPNALADPDSPPDYIIYQRITSMRE